MVEIIECEQNSASWYEARRGLVTASEFSTIMANGRGGGESVTRKKYLYRLAGEIVTGELAETYNNAIMDRGHAMEGDARDAYAFMKDAEPVQVGFVRNGRVGASPDSFIGENGILELKTKQPSVLIETLFRDGFPPEHRAQCQGLLYVCEREFVDLAAYWPRMPLYVCRAYRDDEYIKTIADAVAKFNDELDALVDRIRNYGSARKDAA